MTGTRLNTLALLGITLVAVGCHDGKVPPTALRAEPAPTGPNESARPKATASAPATTVTPSGPIAPVNPSADIPPGPYYPPARADIVPEPSSWRPGVLLRKLERFFKDAAPAGENRSVHPATVSEDGPASTRGAFTADQLRPALRQNTANGKLIGQILDKRSPNVVTARLKAYLQAEDPKTAASAAELVIEEIFATDRKPETKLYELAGDFDEIQRMGYYDEAIAGRRDFLQARLDQAWSSNKTWTSDLPTAILVDVAPALLIGLAAGFRAPVLDTAVGLTEGTVRGAAKLAPLAREAGPALVRNFRLVVTEVINVPAATAVEAKLAQIGIEGLPVTSDKIAAIEKLMVVDGTKFRLAFDKTPHPDFQYAVTNYFNNTRHEGQFIVFRYKPLGISTKVAMTNELSPARVREIEDAILSSRGRVTKITANGIEDSELPVEAIRKVTPTGKPAHAPRAFVEGKDAAAAADEAVTREAGVKPRAFRVGDPNSRVRMVDEPVEPPPAAGPGAASAEGSLYAEPRAFDRKRAVAGFVGGAALMAYPSVVYYGKGSIDGEEREMLYLGGQYDKYVPPTPPEKPQLISELPN